MGIYQVELIEINLNAPDPADGHVGVRNRGAEGHCAQQLRRRLGRRCRQAQLVELHRPRRVRVLGPGKRREIDLVWMLRVDRIAGDAVQAEESVEVRRQMFLVNPIESPEGLSLAVIQLHDGHAGDVLLQERVDLRNRDSDAAVRIAGFHPENCSCDEDQRYHRHRHQTELPVQNHDGDHDSEECKDVAENRNNAGGEHFVEDVDIRRDPRDQAADRILVVKRRRERVQMPEDLHAHVVHDVLAGVLQHVSFGRSHNESDSEQNDVYTRDHGKAGHVRCRDISIDGDLREPGKCNLQARLEENQHKRQSDVLLIWPQISQQAVHQARVVSFTENVFILHALFMHPEGVPIYSLTASSSSSNCRRCNSA